MLNELESDSELAFIAGDIWHIQKNPGLGTQKTKLGECLIMCEPVAHLGNGK
jgi:hypothetical protein